MQLPVKQTEFIKKQGGKTLHHGVRVAQSIGYAPNLFVTIKFWETSLTVSEMSDAFFKFRANFGKWIQRPRRQHAAFSVPPTHLWVLENPNSRFHAHWLLYVPAPRQLDFGAKLNKWLTSSAKVYSQEPIHVIPVSSSLGLVRYMLKGQFPAIARKYGIDPEPQGWIPGGKRSGCSENIGPTRHATLYRSGKHPRPQPFRLHKYPAPLISPQLRAV